MDAVKQDNHSNQRLNRLKRYLSNQKFRGRYSNHMTGEPICPNFNGGFGGCFDCGAPDHMAGDPMCPVSGGWSGDEW